MQDLAVETLGLIEPARDLLLHRVAADIVERRGHEVL